jgi:hypothetical protein
MKLDAEWISFQEENLTNEDLDFTLGISSVGTCYQTCNIINLIIIKISSFMFVAHFGITTLVMLPFIAPMLAILGISLMFPTRIYFKTSVARNNCGLACKFDRFASHFQDTLQVMIFALINMVTLFEILVTLKPDCHFFG